MMIKICYVTTISISLKSFFIPQLKFLAKNGFEVSVICSPDEGLQALLGEEIRYIPLEIPRGVDAIGSLKAIRELTKIFKREKFDFIQYSTPNAALYASIAAKRVKTKVRNYHLMGLRYLGETGWKKKLLYLFDRWACNKSTHVECVSPSNLVLAVEEKLFKMEKGVVVWNGSSGGIDLQRFNIQKRESYRKEIREKYDIGKEELIFGFVGRITKDKGVNELLAAFAKIDGAKLLMVGPQEGIETLDQERYQMSLRDENIIYTGLVSDVEKYYCAIDVLIFPSYREGFGNVVMEAAAMGTPSIVSNIPGPIDAVKENETALIVAPRDSEALYQAMVKMLDGELRAHLSKNAVRFVTESFDQEILMQRILERKLQLLKE